MHLTVRLHSRDLATTIVHRCVMLSIHTRLSLKPPFVVVTLRQLFWNMITESLERAKKSSDSKGLFVGVKEDHVPGVGKHGSSEDDR